ncbi:GNAT family N-acetyltransferase [Sapientia aquatica]|uniref:N-acetyltransferase n=1 Tax=Sapientia aquatica TaxID=1549640 RepID=A0A4V3AU82_9BURK|nr:N-acetyltransferase [Sapientia aquatica]TDK63463.1 N-acetyltransferase [Sapientia aquatica]
MPTNTTIRFAQEHDLAELASLFNAYRIFYEQPSDRAVAENFLRERMQHAESVILVADNPEAHPGHKLDGFCQLYPTFCSVEAKPIAVLYDLFVAPSARGRGVARRLMLAAQDYAKSSGKARLDLSTAKNNYTAQALYESLGYERDDVFYTYNLGIEK